jgi:hypothetical protein
VVARLVSVCLTTVLIGCGLFGSGANPGLTDAEYLAIARGAPPAQAFSARYGATDESVDRSGRLAVDFRAGGARLRVFIENDRAIDAFVECPPGTIRTGDVVAAVRACP